MIKVLGSVISTYVPGKENHPRESCAALAFHKRHRTLSCKAPRGWDFSGHTLRRGSAGTQWERRERQGSEGGGLERPEQCGRRSLPHTSWPIGLRCIDSRTAHHWSAALAGGRGGEGYLRGRGEPWGGHGAHGCREKGRGLLSGGGGGWRAKWQAQRQADVWWGGG